MKRQFYRLVALSCLTALGVLSAPVVQAQTMSSAKVESVLTAMMDQPVSLFLGVPIDFDTLTATASDGSESAHEVVFGNANIAGLPLGDLSMAAKVEASGSLSLTADLAALLGGMAGTIGTTFEAETLRLTMTINPEALSTERLTLTADNILAGDPGNEATDYLRFDGAVFMFDERKNSPTSSFDFGIDNLAFAIDGEELVSLETLGLSFEMANTPGWFLQQEINAGIMQFFMVEAGAVTPMEGIANLIDRLVPLFETQQVDAKGSFDVGALALNDVDLLDSDGRVLFDGMSVNWSYDHDGQISQTAGDIGRLQVLAENYWSDEGREYALLDFEGGALSATTTYAQPYDLQPLAGVLSGVSESIRGMGIEEFIDPDMAMIGLYLGAAGPLLDWTVATLDDSDLKLALGALTIEIPESSDESLKLALQGIDFLSLVDFDAEGDLQELSASLYGLEVILPEPIGFSAGEISASYLVHDSFTAIKDAVVSLQENTLTLADGIQFALGVYLPDLLVGVKDVSFYAQTPTQMGEADVYLGSADISFTTQDMQSDQAKISQLIAYSGLKVNFTDEIMFDPTLVDLVLGKNGPGLLPSDATVQVDLAEIPMEMILAIAGNVQLPPLDVMLSPDFDPTSLAMAGAALLSPILASPPSLVLQPSNISGGMVELTASGELAINPLMPPNYAVGSVTIRVSGVAEAQQQVGELLGAIDSGEVEAYPDTYETLQQIVGGLAIAGGFGIPADDGALEFILDLPMGEPANINGLPIPVPF